VLQCCIVDYSETAIFSPQNYTFTLYLGRIYATLQLNVLQADGPS